MKFRKLRIAWSVFFGIACVLLIVLWVRSYTTFDRLTVQPPRDSNYLVISYQGHIAAVRVGFLGSSLIGRERKWINRDSGPVNPTNRILEDKVWPFPSIMGFGWISKQSYSNIPNAEAGWLPSGIHDRSWTADATGFRMPYWCPAILLAVVAATGWRIQFRFSLRTLLIATTLVAVVMGLIVWMSRR